MTEQAKAVEQPPYLKRRVTRTVRRYNPDYGDARVCTCGHPYHRHFDLTEESVELQAIGCKYCSCYNFKERAA